MAFSLFLLKVHVLHKSLAMNVGHHVTLGVLMGPLLMTSLEGHYYGAGREACVDMIPQHESRPRDPPAPVDIILSNTTYSPGVPITGENVTVLQMLTHHHVST